MKSIYLGINVGHDQAVAAVDSAGQLVYFAEEERFNRIRFSMFRPTALALEDCLQQTGRAAGDIAGVGVPFDPDRYDAWIEHFFATHGADRESFIPDIHEVLDSCHLISRQCRSVPLQYGIPAEKVRHLPHHLCHAASAFFPSRFESAAVLVIDGSGEDTSATIYHGTGDGLDKLHEIDLPNSLGRLWAQITGWLGLGGLGYEGKTMGLAPYGKPRFVDVFREHLIDWDERGIYTSKSDPLPEPGWLEEVLGPARCGSDALTPASADVAATLQQVTEEIVVRLARFARELTGEAALCYSGGVTLNSVANGRIMAEGVFEDYFFQPAANDAGAALGAAILLQRDAFPASPRWVQKHLYFGSDLNVEETRAALRRRSLPLVEHPRPWCWAAQRLAEGKVVGWVQGRLEYGPRALGNRSILADPRRAEMKDAVNSRVKFREGWRPFAPSVLEELVGEYFAIDYPSPYMIQVYDVRPEWLERIPAVCHLDGTGRVQSVSRETNPAYYDLIEHFQTLTGVGCVLNTSFNVRGEPLVRTPEEAIEDFLRTDLDCLVVGGYVLEKAKLDPASLPETEPFFPHRVNVPESIRQMGRIRSLAVAAAIESPVVRNRLVGTIISCLANDCDHVAAFTAPGATQLPADLDTGRTVRVQGDAPTSLPPGTTGIALVSSFFRPPIGEATFVERFCAAFEDPDEVWIMDQAGTALRRRRGRALWGHLFLKPQGHREPAPVSA